MKIEGTEIAPSGKRRLKIYLGDEELEIIGGLVKQALKHTPSVKDTERTLNFLRAMNRTFDEFCREVASENAISPEASETAQIPYECTIVRFDGGSPCNDPKKGYGEGYGSYQIGNGTDPVRLKFGQAMSANTAEIRTATSALSSVALSQGHGKWVHIIGDSQIALRWIDRAHSKHPIKVSKGSSEAFIESIEKLYEAVQGFEKIVTEWQPRHKMVAVFGH